MTSAINPNDINDAYPVAGQPNNTQGFRDNFAATKTNFEAAASEITELQTKSVLTAALTGGSALTTQNNMLGAPLIGAKIRNFSADTVNIATTSGPIAIDYSQGHYQRIATTGNIGLSFTNWPTSGSYGATRVQLNIDSAGRTVTLPAAVTYGTTGIEGLANSVITFDQAGTYQFEFSSSDGGGNITIQDLNRPLNVYSYPVHITSNTVSTSSSTGALVVDGGAGILGNVNIGGNLRTYTSTGNVSFQVLDSGVVEFKAPAAIAANTAGALNIVGSSSGNYQAVTNAGGMLHITGNDGVTSRITNDAFGAGANPAYVGRFARGNVNVPAVPQNNDVLSRFVAVGWNGTSYGPSGGGLAPCTIDMVAKETYSGTAQGSEIQFYNAPVGSNARVLSAAITSAGISTAGNVTVTGPGGVALTDGGTVGYGTGAGGSATQSGNKSAGVTINKPSGEITMASTNLAADTTVSFTLTNSTIANHDVMVLNVVSGAATPASYNLDAACNTGNAVISVRNITGGTLGEAIVIRYAVIKGSIT